MPIVFFGSMRAPKPSFQLLGSKNHGSGLAADLLPAHCPPYSLLGAFLLVVLSTLGLGISPSYATSTASCVTASSSWVNPLAGAIPYSPGYVTPFPDWAVRLSITPACMAYATTWYNDQLAKGQSKFQADSLTSFSNRLNNCMKGQSVSVWNPSSYVNLSRCVVIVSFVPSSKVLSNSLNDTMNTINTHVPLSFISLGINVALTMEQNWSYATCSTNLTTLKIKLLSAPNYVTSSSSNASVNIAIPCQPNDPVTGKPLAYIQQLKFLMLVPLYVFVLWWLLRIGNNFLHRIMS